MINTHMVNRVKPWLPFIISCASTHNPWHGRHGSRCIADKHGLVADIFHVQADLFGDLAEDFLRQVAFPDGFIETHELDNVAGADPASVISQQLAITVKLLHQLELLTFADSDDDYASGQVGCIDDQSFDSAHVVNSSVREDQQNVVDIALLGLGRIHIKFTDDRSE